MRTDLDHLPPAKRRELERVVQILFEEFDEARSLATQDWKKKGRILKIILYGSYGAPCMAREVVMKRHNLLDLLVVRPAAATPPTCGE